MANSSDMLNVKYKGTIPVDVPGSGEYEGVHFEPGDTKPMHKLLACGLVSLDFEIQKPVPAPKS